MSPEIALLVDGDQLPTQGLAKLIQDLERKWTVSERIVVRNWRSTRDQQEWRLFSDEHGFRCIQRDPVATGKNAADIELAIISVDLLHAGYKAFCLVTGDMDFTPVVQRIRRSGAHIDWVRPEELPGYSKASRGRRSATKRTKTPAKAPAKAVPKTKAPAKAAPTRRKTAPRQAQSPSGPTQKQRSFGKHVRRAIAQMRRDGNHDKGWVSVNRLGSILASEGLKREDFDFAKSRPLRQVLEDLEFKVMQIETGAYRVTLE